jgi:cysteine dioxygenase
MPIDTHTALVAALRQLADTEDLNLKRIQAFAARIELTEDLQRHLQNPDPTHPYGRTVLFESESLECMVATWTPGMPCRPHDHGGSWGAVRILQGRARHRIWSLRNGQMTERRVHTASSGDVLACGPSMVHSMGVDDVDRMLLTLHLYTRSIDHMVVYDVENSRTHVVEGSCGAWIPDASSGLLRSSTPGLLCRTELCAA